MATQYGGRGPKKLTSDQERALAFVKRADDRWREAKLNARAELRRQIEEHIAMHAATRDQAVFEAVQAGVPKSRITNEALRTSPNALYEILDRVESNLTVAGVEAAQPERAPYEWSERVDVPNGYYHFLRVEGDDHKIIQAGFEGDGYLRHVDIAGRVGWVGGKPDEAAQRWAEENPPE